jgi:hypothetical protein
MNVFTILAVALFFSKSVWSRTAVSEHGYLTEGTWADIVSDRSFVIAYSLLFDFNNSEDVKDAVLEADEVTVINSNHNLISR